MNFKFRYYIVNYKREIFLSISFLLSIVIICIIVWVFRLPSETGFKLDVKSKSLTFKLAKDWGLEEKIHLNSFEAYPIKKLSTSDGIYEISKFGNMEFAVSRGDIRISNLNFEKGTIINIRVDGNELLIKSLNKQVFGELETKSGQLQLLGAKQDSLFSLPQIELVEFETYNQECVLAFYPIGDNAFSIKKLPLEGGLSFNTKNSIGKSDSTVLYGEIEVEGKTYEVNSKSNIVLESLDESYAFIKNENDFLSLHLEGRSKIIEYGYPNNMNSLVRSRFMSFWYSEERNLLSKFLLGLSAVIAGVFPIITYRLALKKEKNKL